MSVEWVRRRGCPGFERSSSSSPAARVGGSSCSPHTRAKPAVSFAGTHRLIDFPLSNCLNSAIGDVWVVAAVQPGLALRPPLQRPRRGTWTARAAACSCCTRSEGNDGAGGLRSRARPTCCGGNAQADPRVRPAGAGRRLAPTRSTSSTTARSSTSTARRATTVTHGDHDRRPRGRRPLRRRAGRAAARCTGYALQAGRARTGNLIANEVFVFEPAPRARHARRARRGGRRGRARGPRARAAAAPGRRRRASREHRFDGYWRDVGTIPAYWQAHQELAAGRAADRPRRARPGRSSPTPQDNRASGRICAERGGRRRALLAPGRDASPGSVERSVIGRGAHGRDGRGGARTRSCSPAAIVRAGATVERAILDDGVEVAG